MVGLGDEWRVTGKQGISGDRKSIRPRSRSQTLASQSASQCEPRESWGLVDAVFIFIVVSIFIRLTFTTPARGNTTIGFGTLWNPSEPPGGSGDLRFTIYDWGFLTRKRLTPRTRRAQSLLDYRRPQIGPSLTRSRSSASQRE